MTSEEIDALSRLIGTIAQLKAGGSVGGLVWSSTKPTRVGQYLVRQPGSTWPNATEIVGPSTYYGPSGAEYLGPL